MSLNENIIVNIKFVLSHTFVALYTDESIEIKIQLINFITLMTALFCVQRIMSPSMSSLLFLVVGLSMAVTPWLGALGQSIATRFEKQDMQSLLPAETEARK